MIFFIVHYDCDSILPASLKENHIFQFQLVFIELNLDRFVFADNRVADLDKTEDLHCYLVSTCDCLNVV